MMVLTGKRTSRPIRIGLLGPYGSGNLGDAAIQEAVIRNIRTFHTRAEIVGISLNPDDTMKRHGISAIPIHRLCRTGVGEAESPNPRTRLFPIFGRIVSLLRGIAQEAGFLTESYHALKRIDLLIVSGGGQLDEYWGGPWGHPFNLLKWGILSRLTGTKYIFLSVGAGSLDTALSRLFAKGALSLACYKSFRDETTRVRISMLGVNRTHGVVPDLAFSLPVEGRKIPETVHGEANHIGISPISPSAWRTGGNGFYKAYKEKLIDGIVWLVERGCIVTFFLSQVRMDRVVVDDLIELLGKRGYPPSSGCIREPNPDSLNGLMGQISGVDIVVASRLHSVILAYLLAKPVLAISYDRKVNALMDDMGHSEYCLDINAFSPEEFRQTFERIERDLETVRLRITKRLVAYRKSLDHQYRNVLANSQSI